MKLKDLKKGEYFVRMPYSKIVLVKGDYCRSLKKYSCTRFDDVCKEHFLSQNMEVYEPLDF